MGTGHIRIAELVLLGLYPALLCASIGADVARRIIPNAVVVSLIAAFAAGTFLVPVPDLIFRLAAAGTVTALGFSLFAEDIIGAGDAKLAGVIVLWVDPLQLPLFVLATGTIGAMLGIAAAARHRFAGVDDADLADRRRASLPYGVALAGAGLIIHPLSSLLHP